MRSLEDPLTAYPKAATLGFVRSRTHRKQRLTRRFGDLRASILELPCREAVDLLVEEVGHLRTYDEIAIFSGSQWHRSRSDAQPANT